MGENNNGKGRKSKRIPIIVALVAGVSIAVLAGVIINTTLPRNTFALDVIHPPRSVTVTIPAGASLPDGNTTFTPKEVTVILGVNNTVVWVNENINPERVVGQDENMAGGFGKINSLIEPNGGTFAFTFTEEGTYEYLSDIHPWLQGTVVVKSMQSQDILVQRSEMSTALAVSHPEVEKALEDVHRNNIVIDYDWLDNSIDRVTITTRGFLITEPLYSNFTGSLDRQGSMFETGQIDVKRLVDAVGYREIFTQNQEIEVDIDRRTNEVLSVKIGSAPDAVTTTRFTDGERKALSIALADNRVKNIIEARQFYLTQIRESGVGFNDQFGQHCGERECSLVGLALASQESFGVHTSIILNPNTEEIVDLRSGT